MISPTFEQTSIANKKKFDMPETFDFKRTNGKY
jgi:hypothetical protein